MNFNDYDNTIFIVKDSAKKGLLKHIRKRPSLLNIKMFTLSELKKKWFFDYDKEAIYYVSRKYNVISDVAKIYIDNLYYIKDIDNEKIAFLKTIKAELSEKKLLKTHEVFHSFLHGKKIVLYELENIDLFYKNIFDELSKGNEIIEYNSGDEGTKKKLYKAKTKEEEIAFVASSIVKLIKSGVDINKIFLANVQDDYYFTIKNIFKEFNIPILLPSKSSISGTRLVNIFKELYSSDMNLTLNKLSESLKSEDDKKIYRLILKTVNDYAWCNDYIDVRSMIFSDLNNIMLPEKIVKNTVRVIDFVNEYISDDDYIFLINFNQGVIPIEYKDEDYLNDNVKEKLGISTSIDLNKKALKETQKRIKAIKNLIVSYSEYDLTGELYISNAYSSELFIEKEIEIDYTLSNKYNKRLLTCDLDEYKKYGTTNKELNLLSSHYKDFNYNTYNNVFKGISSNKIKKFLNNKLTLSYTSMNTYFQCGFRYYLEYILKINKYEDSFQIIIGNIFHNILSIAFNDNFNFEACWNNEIKNTTYTFNAMELFFLEKLKSELTLVIDTIKRQLEYTELHDALYEEEVFIEVDKNINLYFKGFIDKILYKEEDGITYAVIIDYKTGSTTLSLTGIPYGLDMQLPVYIYLLKNSKKIKNVRVGGFYLQKILDDITDIEKRLDSLKLVGYTNSDINVIKKVDSSYENSKIIKSLKTTANGFSAYSKLLSDDEMNKLTNIVEDKIIESSKDIMDAKFEINPKELDNKLIGCTFCKYKDICFMKNEDIIKLKGVTKEELLGGEVHA